MAPLPHYDCLSCGHKWIPRSDKAPKVCPKCKSEKWNAGSDDIAYFIQAGENGAIKVGTTNNILARINLFKTHHDKELIVRLLIPGGIYVEREVSKRFKHLRIRGEWYSPGEDLISYMETLKDQNITADLRDAKHALISRFNGNLDGSRKFEFVLPRELYPIFEKMSIEADIEPSVLARRIIASYIEQKTGTRMPRIWDSEHK